MSRKGVAECGHPGSYVTPTFISCDRRCEFPKTAPPEVLPLEGDEDFSDGVPFDIDFDLDETAPFCAHCGSADVAIYPGFYATGRSLWFCNACAQSFPGKP